VTGPPVAPQQPVARVVATVGTDHHPFDRLIGWLDHWAEAHPDVPMLVQVGTTPPGPARPQVRYVEMLGYHDLIAAMGAADVVVAQGGPGGITDARGVGRLPVVVPRRGSLGEHVDDHQVRFSAWMAARGLIELASDEAELHRLLDVAVADPGALRIAPDAGSVTETVERFRAIVDPLLAERAARSGTSRSGWVRRRHGDEAP